MTYVRPKVKPLRIGHAGVVLFTFIIYFTNRIVNKVFLFIFVYVLITYISLHHDGVQSRNSPQIAALPWRHPLTGKTVMVWMRRLTADIIYCIIYSWSNFGLYDHLISFPQHPKMEGYNNGFFILYCMFHRPSGGLVIMIQPWCALIAIYYYNTICVQYINRLTFL